MNNVTLYPCERNLYYSGKVLSVSNFETEQKYMNDKRRILNRYGMGFGILCGLEAVVLSREEICVEAGIAIDPLGREIVVPQPDIRKLTALTGYDRSKKDADYYLYIKYDEEKTGAAKDASGETDGLRYDKMLEGYHLFLTTKAPFYGEMRIDSFYRTEQTVFENKLVRVTLSLPRYIQSGEKFLMLVHVSRLTENVSLRFSGSVALSGCRKNEQEKMDVSYDSNSVRRREYDLVYILDALNVYGDVASVEMRKQDMSFTVGGETAEMEKDVTAEMAMMGRPVVECVLEDYRHSLMRIASLPSQEDVCLGRIAVRDGKVASVEDIPSQPYMHTPEMLHLENRILKEELFLAKRRTAPEEAAIREKKEEEPEVLTVSGEAVISLGIGGRAGKRFFSEEITHGLGIGNVSVVLGFKDSVLMDDAVIYGSSEVFDEEIAGDPAELAAKVNPQKGTFVIGARLLRSTNKYEMTVCWTATKQRESRRSRGERKIVIADSMKTLHVMESVYLSVKFVNMPKTDVVWHVEGEDAGTVSENGCYTAPGSPGVYKVVARVAASPEIYAGAYIVVKPD